MTLRINNAPIKNPQAEKLLRQLSYADEFKFSFGDNQLSEHEFASILNLNYPAERRFNSQDIIDFNTKTGLSVDDYFILMQEYRRHFSEDQQSVRTPHDFGSRFLKWERVIFTHQQLKRCSNQELIAIVSYFWPRGQKTKFFPSPYAKCEKGLCQQLPGVKLPDWFVELYVTSEKPMREKNITNFLVNILTARYGSLSHEDLALFLDIVAINKKAYGSDAFLERIPALIESQQQTLAKMSDTDVLKLSIHVAYAEDAALLAIAAQSPDMLHLIQLTSPVRHDRGQFRGLIAADLRRREEHRQENWSDESIQAMITTLEEYHTLEVVYHSIDIGTAPAPMLAQQFKEAARLKKPDIDKVGKAREP